MSCGGSPVKAVGIARFDSPEHGDEVIMLVMIGKLVLGKILANPHLKTMIFVELRKAAAKTAGTKLDDVTVDALEVVWDVAIPILVAGKK